EVGRGEVCIASHEGISAVPEESRNSPLGLSTHGESRGKRMPESMPAYTVAIQLGGYYGRPKDPAVEITLIQGCGERLRGIDKRTHHALIHLLNLPCA